MLMAKDSTYHYNGPSAEDRALETFANLMIDKIKNIQQDWKKPWFTEGSMAWPRNLNGREYNGMNAIGLILQGEKMGYDLPFYCTFNRVSGLNYTFDKDGNRKPMMDAKGEKLPTVSVNKGEKSFPVFITTFTVVNKETKEKMKYDDYKQLSDEEKKDYNVFPKLNVYNVFNVAQTNLKEARPELYEKLAEQIKSGRQASLEGDKTQFPAMDEMIKKNLWVCPIKPTHDDNAFYSISKDEIVIPEKSQFKDGESFYTNLLHEMIHSTGSENRLNRIKPGSTFGSKEYATEELRAELGAALTASRYGMTKHVKEDSAAYMKAWLESLQESPDFIKTILTDVKRASHMIDSRIDLVQGQIEAYQAKTGNEHEYPDVYDIDNDGNTNEVAHVDHPVEDVNSEAARAVEPPRFHR
jgi:antirestriction protein ArdC